MYIAIVLVAMLTVLYFHPDAKFDQAVTKEEQKLTKSVK